MRHPVLKPAGIWLVDGSRPQKSQEKILTGSIWSGGLSGFIIFSIQGCFEAGFTVPDFQGGFVVGRCDGGAASEADNRKPFGEVVVLCRNRWFVVAVATDGWTHCPGSHL